MNSKTNQTLNHNTYTPFGTYNQLFINVGLFALVVYYSHIQ